MEIAVLVSDAYQGIGLGKELVRRLIEIARDEKLERIVAKILPENSVMYSLAEYFGFRSEPWFDPDSLAVVLNLPSRAIA